MKRTIILLLDSFGVGAAADADTFVGSLKDGQTFTDAGSNTLGHIAQTCANEQANEGRSGPLFVPNMIQLGLAEVGFDCSGYKILGATDNILRNALYGHAKEISTAKDTSSGHWEIAGVPVLFDWGYFRDKSNSFPSELLDELVKRADLPGYLGNCHASGTTILEELGEEHIATGKPIFYTSMDSVFQIACHEESFGLERLYKLCELARELVDEYQIGRVIARPFSGTNSHNFQRTSNRHDYSVSPPAPTLLDKMKDSGGEVVSIGKISDIFAGNGITKAVKAFGIDGLFDASLNEFKTAQKDSIIFTNFVNFDADFGHRRNVDGYAKALEYFDLRLPEILAELGDDDLLVITADHGCDPTWLGTDHTREHIPVLFYGKSLQGKSIGLRDTFADIGQSIASFHQLPALDYGKSFL
ncbi:phosphopentomutase [Psychromonas sp. RZ22]|uniref:phosphopentomutase n=1 Tax=Psychromonas algarum TaxID=2555643 RepID=UPI0010684ABA|nr:phosphopentomutase [Psychromonas sp. RZ22]TEW53706.1 phosphopentomutase [Psychromonas sp. RZ22]